MAEAHIWLAQAVIATTGYSGYSEAIAHYTDAIRLDPKSWEAVAGRGNTFTKLGKYDEAISDDTALLALDETGWHGAMAYNNRCYDRVLKANLLGKEAAEPLLKEALADCDASLKLAPNYDDALDSRGYVLLKLGESERALADLDHCISLSPKYYEAHYHRGLTLIRLKRYPEAVTAFGRAIEMFPNYWAAYHYRAEANFMQSQYERAIQDEDIVIEKVPSWSRAYFLRAWAKKGLGRKEEAKSDFRRACDLKYEPACKQ